MDRAEYTRVVKERFGDPETAAVEAVADIGGMARQPGSVPACPHCGYTPGGMGRYKVMRPHYERRMTPRGIRETAIRCPGSGEPPEYVMPLRTDHDHERTHP